MSAVKRQRCLDVRVDRPSEVPTLVLELSGVEYELHPQWLREHFPRPEERDARTGQRLAPVGAVDPPVLSTASVLPEGVCIEFADGHVVTVPVDTLAEVVGVDCARDAPPRPTPWSGGTRLPDPIRWSELVGPAFVDAIDDFLRFGVMRIVDAPTDAGTLFELADLFGPIQQTGFGALFDVRSMPNAVDLAYTTHALPAHTDQPYRRSPPSVQLLHALRNDAAGGESTLADGLWAVERLQHEDPSAFEALCSIEVEFRYDVDMDASSFNAPIIDMTPRGEFRMLRFSPRLDYAPLSSHAQLDDFYRGRRWLIEHFGSEHATWSHQLQPGEVLLFDNHRIVHGRRSFTPTGEGQRHLQGCYVDRSDIERMRLRSLRASNVR